MSTADPNENDHLMQTAASPSHQILQSSDDDSDTDPGINQTNYNVYNETDTPDEKEAINRQKRKRQKKVFFASVILFCCFILLATSAFLIWYFLYQDEAPYCPWCFEESPINTTIIPTESPTSYKIKNDIHIKYSVY